MIFVGKIRRIAWEYAESKGYINSYSHCIISWGLNELKNVFLCFVNSLRVYSYRHIITIKINNRTFTLNLYIMVSCQ